MSHETQALVQEARQLYEDAQQETRSHVAHRLEHEALGKLLEAIEALMEDI